MNSGFSLKDYQPISPFVDCTQLTCVRQTAEAITAEGGGHCVKIYATGRVYEGQWRGGMRNGRGYEVFPNGDVYEGQYQRNKPHGYGVLKARSGELYQGEWRGGMKEGSGIWRGIDGCTYIGEWQRGVAEGYGVHTWGNGDRFQGQFKNNLKHGEGVQKFNNGDSYKGTYSNGKPQGTGEYYWAGGSYYKGQFVNGLRQGQGVWKSQPGHSDKYEGQYAKDMKHGYGTYTYTSGDMYVGNYEKDVRAGYGQLHSSSGQITKGQWQGDSLQQDAFRIVVNCYKELLSQPSDFMFSDASEPSPRKPSYSNIHRRIIPKTSCSQRRASVQEIQNKGYQHNKTSFHKYHQRMDASECALHRSYISKKIPQAKSHMWDGALFRGSRGNISNKQCFRGSVMERTFLKAVRFSQKQVKKPQMHQFIEQLKESIEQPIKKRIIKTSGGIRNKSRGYFNARTHAQAIFIE